jgi:hypothetical protein
MNPEPPPRSRRFLQGLLAVVAAGLLVLPLLHLLQRQGSEHAALLAMRATLDPLAASVEVQRAVLQHDEASHTVLANAAGDNNETLRRVWQAEVDARSIALDHLLLRGQWQRAGAEAAAMRDDWARLLDRIERRSIAGAESRLAHRLIVEQLLTVVDLATLHSAKATPPWAIRSTVAAVRPRHGATLAETELALARLELERAAIRERLDALERNTILLLATLAVLAVLAVVMLVALRALRRQAPAAQAHAEPKPPQAQPSASPSPAGPKQEAATLLARLRTAAPSAAASASPTGDRSATRDR